MRATPLASMWVADNLMDIPILKNIHTRFFSGVDWILLLCALGIAGLGLSTMNSFADANIFFERQILWITLGVLVCFLATKFEYRFLHRSGVVFSIFALIALTLLSLFIVGSAFQGAERWIDLGWFAIQPSDPAKIVIIILLAKYFSRRHIEIANIRHILVSGLYAGVIAFLIFLQPDFSSALIILGLWFGMVLVSGISKKHFLLLVSVGVIAGALLWGFVLEDYQKQRVVSFLNPLADIQGAGYNAFQSTIAVGSGEMFGKGVGYGTQSRLQFLPEYQTDFIFAAFAEEWGFFGVLLLLILFSILFIRLFQHAYYAASNFETLFTLGVAVWFMMHIGIHIGMNTGLLPVTGITLPFMSYGGSHTLTEFFALGMVMGMSRLRGLRNRQDMRSEVVDMT